MLGNILPVPVLIPLCPAGAVLPGQNSQRSARYFQKIIDITWPEAFDKLGNYEYLGLYLFVAVPMPGTGAGPVPLIATPAPDAAVEGVFGHRPWVDVTSGSLMAGSWGILGLFGIGGLTDL